MTDVLVVGAGSAGSILAERLSADPDRRVTVVEAGPGLDEPLVRALTDDGLSLPIDPDSPVVRRYPARLTGDRVVDIIRGACVGGSGAVNGCYFWPAPPEDFAAMPGWSWSEVEGHFRAVQARIPARVSAQFSSVTEGFIAAADATGHRYGIAAVPLNMDDGRRLGPGAMFLEPALQRPNLTVLTRTRVTRVRLRGSRAVGVDTLGPDGPRELDADRIVLTAGAIATAQLLMLSGIGPAKSLGDLGIAVHADLPVGLASWDHPEWVMPTSWPPERDTPVLEVVLNDEDLEIRPYTTGFGAAAIGIGVALMRPRARGRVTPASTDPLESPVIEHRYDSEHEDLEALRRGCRLVAGIVGTGVGEPVWSTSQHLAGTAPMGTGGGAVVDPRLRVHGIENLWVADGSVLPTPLGRGPHATIAMIGHRAADLI